MTVGVSIGTPPLDGTNVDRLPAMPTCALSRQGRQPQRDCLQCRHRNGGAGTPPARADAAALEKDEFELFYQPWILCGRKIQRLRALLRWRHPDRIIDLPTIAVAEDMG
jgi:hypothetical protein